MRPTGIPGIQQVRRIMEDGQELAFLDLGFNIWLPARGRALDGYADRDLVLVEQGSLGWKVTAFNGDKQDRWLYAARLDHVVDGDTIVVFIELGLGVRTRQILRLNAVNAAALTEPAGVQARDYLVEQIGDAGSVLLRTYKRDKYARFVADVLVGRSGDSVDGMLANGLFLNQALLDQNLAIRA
ncbi:MAG: hypothetical protein KDK39_14470 [Leptospiraceae bacterium]|nr:hypothetical protein [Leptospiraceae bacterium]